MNEPTNQPNKEKPEIYALRQNGADWQMSRRDFLKAAGIGAAALTVSMESAFVRPASAEEDLSALCASAQAHQLKIDYVFTSADGKYLLSVSGAGSSFPKLKVWSFSSHVLLGRKELKSAFYHPAIGFVSDKSALLWQGQTPGSVSYLWMNDPVNGAVHYLQNKIDKSDKLTCIAGSRSGCICVGTCTANYQTESSVQKLYVLKRKNGSDKYEDPVVFEISDYIQDAALFDNDRKLFALFSSGECGIFDLSNGSLNKFDVSSVIRFAMVPGETSVLLSLGEEKTGHEYRLYSLLDGSLIRQEESTLGFYCIAVTPDASMAIFVHESSIALLSLKDGEWIASNFYGDIKFPEDSRIAVSGDGQQIAVSRYGKLMFISLPDLELIGCPVDLKEMKDDSSGIEVSATDAVTGKTVTYTLPCGAALPKGAVCTCNCVAGRGGCAVNCSCDSHRSSSYSSSGGSHYWHPN